VLKLVTRYHETKHVEHVIGVRLGWDHTNMGTYKSFSRINLQMPKNSHKNFIMLLSQDSDNKEIASALVTAEWRAGK